MAAITGSDGGDGRLECMTSFVFKGSVQSYRYYLSRRTVLEMLRDRGYDVADSELIRSQTEFRAVFGEDPDLERLRIRVSLRSDPRKKILVIFMGTNVITKPIIHALRGQILHEQLHGFILILQSKMNAFARKELLTFGFKVEIFQITDLLSNITKHLLMPKVEVLTADEKLMLMKKYKLEDKQVISHLYCFSIAPWQNSMALFGHVLEREPTFLRDSFLLICPYTRSESISKTRMLVKPRILLARLLSYDKAPSDASN